MDRSYVAVRVYEELNDHLPPRLRKKRFAHPVPPHTRVSDLLNDLGIPAKSVEIVLVNGASVPFSHPLQPGDNVSAFPMFESFDIRPLLRERNRPLRAPRFLTDRGLEGLFNQLARQGFDVRHGAGLPHSLLVDWAKAEHRILLVLRLPLLPFHHLLRIPPSPPQVQFRYVMSRLQLAPPRPLGK